MAIAKKLCSILAFSVISSIAVTGCAATQPYVGTTYYFDWNIAGNSAVAPVQIFDDGKREWVQFADPTRIPAIFAETAGGQIVLTWTYEPPYVVIDHPESALVFRVGKRIARAVRGARNGPPEAAQVGMAAPVRITGMAPDPLTQDGLASRRQRLDTLSSMSGTGMQPTMATEAGSYRGRTSATAFPSYATQNAAAIPAAASNASRFVEPGSYTMTPADGTVAAALTRWGAQTGWTIQWDTSISAPITGNSTITGSLTHAVSGVVLGLRQAGYPVWVSPADPVNRTFRVFETQTNESFSEIQR